MNQSTKIFVAITVLLSFAALNAQIKKAKTESVKIYGNCNICECAIKKAGNIRKETHLEWNKDTKIATLNYDSIKTNQDEILKRIALAGYDSDKFLAPDDVYAKLPKCCQYDRINKSEIIKIDKIKNHPIHNNNETVDTLSETKKKTSPLKLFFENYFILKDALVKSDGFRASSKAKDLLNSLNAVQMGKLSNEEQMVWMKVIKDLKFDIEHIVKTKLIQYQRINFISLSDNIYQLIKVSIQETPTYYQHCPMANEGKGANWLSKENEIKNPYYGSVMLSCGKTIEIIK